MDKIIALLKLLRIKHWVKNFLVFLPLVFGLRISDVNLLVRTIKGFFIFCIASSVVYIINDIHDVKSDRQHPTKCKRPIASGIIPIPVAWGVAIVFLLILLFVNFIDNKGKAFGILLIYLGINFLYSIGKLKNVPIVDIIILSSGFLLRLLYGSIITEIPISSWLYLTVLLASFFFALGKRRNEIGVGKDTREVLKKGYTHDFLDKNMYMCATLAIAFYSLWCIDNITVTNWGKGLLLTVPFVIVIFMRYSMIIEGESDGDPVEVVLSDTPLLVLCVLYALAVVGIIHFL